MAGARCRAALLLLWRACGQFEHLVE